MTINPALLSPLSALLGALIGGSTSLIAAIYKQHGEDRLQRVAAEVAKRETIYGEFLLHASNLLMQAYTRQEIALSGDEHRLMGLINRMRFFASPKVVAAAEAALRAIFEIALKPSVELRQLATQFLSGDLEDPLLEFSLVCKAEPGPRASKDGVKQRRSARVDQHGSDPGRSVSV